MDDQMVTSFPSTNMETTATTSSSSSFISPTTHFKNLLIRYSSIAQEDVEDAYQSSSNNFVSSKDPLPYDPWLGWYTAATLSGLLLLFLVCVGLEKIKDRILTYFEKRPNLNGSKISVKNNDTVEKDDSSFDQSDRNLYHSNDEELDSKRTSKIQLTNHQPHHLSEQKKKTHQPQYQQTQLSHFETNPPNSCSQTRQQLQCQPHYQKDAQELEINLNLAENIHRQHTRHHLMNCVCSNQTSSCQHLQLQTESNKSNLLKSHESHVHSKSSSCSSLSQEIRAIKGVGVDATKQNESKSLTLKEQYQHQPQHMQPEANTKISTVDIVDARTTQTKNSISNESSISNNSNLNEFNHNKCCNSSLNEENNLKIVDRYNNININVLNNNNNTIDSFEECSRTSNHLNNESIINNNNFNSNNSNNYNTCSFEGSNSHYKNMCINNKNKLTNNETGSNNHEISKINLNTKSYNDDNKLYNCNNDILTGYENISTNTNSGQNNHNITNNKNYIAANDNNSTTNNTDSINNNNINNSDININNTNNNSSIGNGKTYQWESDAVVSYGKADRTLNDVTIIAAQTSMPTFIMTSEISFTRSSTPQPSTQSILSTTSVAAIPSSTLLTESSTTPYNVSTSAATKIATIKAQPTVVLFTNLTPPTSITAISKNNSCSSTTCQSISDSKTAAMLPTSNVFHAKICSNQSTVSPHQLTLQSTTTDEITYSSLLTGTLDITATAANNAAACSASSVTTTTTSSHILLQ
ncbi:hypothetical protein HELRODRAFT_167756 [Helobdella robusta]|uniref:Uncharacterized protein n=1 Tax=Helobdella robusta TaxID=6412 RepID=T1EZR6_HELRO|nr:hypothetical protein HELRODRAFT_167756 [Helobdella robusta]ESO09931.1 hypothetical protein HELRODRAFT_167756 [Helobdella robusta]